MEQPEANLNLEDDARQTPLHIASSLRQINVVTMLLEKGCKANSLDIFGGPPLRGASSTWLGSSITSKTSLHNITAMLCNRTR